MLTLFPLCMCLAHCCYTKLLIFLYLTNFALGNNIIGMFLSGIQNLWNVIVWNLEILLSGI